VVANLSRLMSVRVRLTRVGSKKNPIWRVVVADQRSPRDGRFIETIGQYNPQTDPSTIRIDSERLDHWLARGAQPTNTVKQLMKAQTKSGGPTPVHAPAAAVVVDDEDAAEATAEAAVVADAVDAPVPDEADAPAEEAAPEEPAAEGEATPDEATADGGDEPSS
jgi:small subunit ribosomal protein S16